MKALSVRHRLTLAFIGLAVVPLLLLGLVNALQNYRQHTTATLAHVEELAQRVAFQLGTALHQGEQAVDALLRYRNFTRLPAAEQEALLTELQVRHDFIHGVALLDRHGQERFRRSVLAVVHTGDLRDLRADDAFRVPASTGQVHYGSIRYDVDGEPVLGVSIPLHDLRTGLVEAVIRVDMALKPLWDLLASLPKDPGITVYAIDENGDVVAHRNPSVVLRGTRIRLPAAGATMQGLSGAEAFVAVSAIQAGQRVFRVVAEHDWMAAMGLALSELLALAGVMVTALLIAYAGRTHMLRRIVLPIVSVERTARAIAAGDLGRRVTIGSDDEIGNLANSFNAMTDHLQRSLLELQAEVSVRRQAEQALRESREDLKRAQTVGQIGSWRHHLASGELVWSDENYRIFAIPPGTPLAFETFVAAVHPDDRAFVERQWQAALGGAPYDIEHRILVGQEVRWVRERAELERDAAGRLCCGFGITQDITARKRAEQALIESEARYQTLFETMAQGVIYQTADGRITEANRAAERILGLNRDNMQGATDPSWRAVDADGSPLPAERLPTMAALRSGEPVHDVTMGVVNHRDGRPRWLLVSAVPQFHPGADRPFQVYATFTDITERKQSEALLRTRLRLSELARDGILEELTEATAEEARRLTASEVAYFHFVDADQGRLATQAWAGGAVCNPGAGPGPIDETDVWAECIRCRSAVIHNDRSDLAHKTGLPPGHPPLLRDLAVPVVAGGRVTAVLGVGNRPDDYTRDDMDVLQDIAWLSVDLVARKRAEDDLVRRTLELQRINAELEEFAYVASHDLKAPLRAVANLALMIDEDAGGALDDENRQRLRLMRERVRGMHQLIDGLLAYAHLSHGQQERRPVALGPLLTDVVAELAPPPSFRIVLEPPLPTLVADPLQLRQVFQNLIGNAVHHHDRPQGTVWVRARDGGSVWFLEVADDGPGIPPYAREQVFRMFTTDGKAGHSGIGLAAVRKLVLSNGGTIEVSCNEPRGALFRVVWPK